MNFLIDENIPYDAVAALREKGHDVVWIREVARGSFLDFIQKNFLITKERIALHGFVIMEHHLHMIANHYENILKQLKYFYNPVRAGYVDDPVHWRYSSFRHYEGMTCLLPITVLS